MILYLYGLPAVGKNFIGEIIRDKYDFFFKDADIYLPNDMKIKLKNGKHFTREEVSKYHDIIAEKIYQLKLIHPRLVISQASLFKKDRAKIKELNPKVQFIHVKIETLDTIIERLKKRKGYVTETYVKNLLKHE